MRNLNKYNKNIYNVCKIRETAKEIHKEEAEANTGASNRIKISIENVTHARYHKQACTDSRYKKEKTQKQLKQYTKKGLRPIQVSRTASG